MVLETSEFSDGGTLSWSWVSARRAAPILRLEVLCDYVITAVVINSFLRVPGSKRRIEDKQWVCSIEGRGTVGTGRRLS